jgi:hypothetical protein
LRGDGRFLRLVTVLVLVAAGRPVRAERPFDTEDAVPLTPGRVQAEAAASYGHGPDRVDAGVFTQVLTVGVAPKLDLAAQATEIVFDDPRRRAPGGVGDTVLQSKYLVLEERDGRPAILVSPLVRLPTADGPLGLSGVDVQALGVGSKTFGGWNATGNVGYTFATADRRRDVWVIAGSLEWTPTPTWTLGAEGLADLGTSGDHDRAFLRAGVAFVAWKGVLLDAAVAAGVDGVFPDVLVTIGATIDLF